MLLADFQTLELKIQRQNIASIIFKLEIIFSKITSRIFKLWSSIFKDKIIASRIFKLEIIFSKTK
jgi:hypothetical protein